MANINIADLYTTTAKKTELFSDFNVDMQTHPGKRDLLRVTNENSIKRSIINLLQTGYHERFYQPYLGANLKQLLFEPASEDVMSQIKHQILTCIAKFEPRARVTDINLTISPDEHSVYVSLVFATLNNATPTTLSFILNRVR